MMPHRNLLKCDCRFNNWVRRPRRCKRWRARAAGQRGIMALFCGAAPRYIRRMKQLSQMPVATAAKIALGVALLAAATGLAFASWIDKGAGIFMAMVEAGLAWCF